MNYLQNELNNNIAVYKSLPAIEKNQLLQFPKSAIRLASFLFLIEVAI